jgi:HEAT repeat protein
MLADPNSYLRYLAALTLLRREESAAIPVVAAFAADPVLTGGANRAVVEAMKRLAADPPLADESAFAMWERQRGWASIAWPPDRLRALRQVVDQARQGNSPWIDLLLAQLATAPAPRERAVLLESLARHRSSRAAFDALARSATGTAEDEAFQAIYGLAGFTRFPVAETLRPLLATASPRLAAAVVTVAAERRFPGYVDVLEEALRHPEVNVRARAVAGCGAAGLRRLGPRLVQVAEEDPSPVVREAACGTLTELHDARVLPLLGRQLAPTSPAAERQKAVQQLQRWGTTPAAVALLQSYRQDELLGGRITAHLRRLGLSAAP